MNKKLYLFHILLFLLLISCKNDKQKFIQPNFKIEKTKHYKISHFLGSDYKVFKLKETNLQYPIGRINKVIKKANNYFILSNDSQIHFFNDEGNIESILQKKGRGPKEYNRIDDFNITYENGKCRIWIADHKSIKIYELHNQWLLVDEIKLNFIVNKFHLINPNRILLLAGRNNKCLCLINRKGVTLKEYLNREIPFLTFKSVQFIPVKNTILYQLGMSNQFVKFTPETEDFEIVNFSNEKKFITSSQLINLHEKIGFEYFNEIKKENYIKNIRHFKNKMIIDYYKPTNKFLAIVDSANSYHIQITNSKTFVDDILNKKKSNYLNSFFLTISDDSLLLFEILENGNLEFIDFYF